MTQGLARYLLSHRGLGDTPAVLLFGGPIVLRGGTCLEVPEGGKRLLVLIALADAKVDRRHAAGSLWPDGNDERAAGNLRSALWRLRGAGIDVVESDKQFLWLRPGTLVDVTVVSQWARRLADGSVTPADLAAVSWRTAAMDLLPGWYDDWVIFERERIRQRLLHALESLSRHLIAECRYAEAVEAAIVAVSADPLRETANKILVEAHLSEGNLVEAHRSYERYRDLLQRELGVEPGRDLTNLMRRDRREPTVPGPGNAPSGRARLLTAPSSLLSAGGHGRSHASRCSGSRGRPQDRLQQGSRRGDPRAVACYTRSLRISSGHSSVAPRPSRSTACSRRRRRGSARTSAGTPPLVTTSEARAPTASPIDHSTGCSRYAPLEMCVVPMFLFAATTLSASAGMSAPRGIWNGKQSMST